MALGSQRTDLPIELGSINKRQRIFKRAIEEAAKDRGTLGNPRDRLRNGWASDRERLRAAVDPAARVEYDRLTEKERDERQQQGAWVHPEARQLHMAMKQFVVRTSEAGAIVDVWFTVPSFDDSVHAFLRGTLTGEELLAGARKVQKEQRTRRSPRAV